MQAGEEVGKGEWWKLYLCLCLTFSVHSLAFLLNKHFEV